jgi:hypothetical protein
MRSLIVAAGLFACLGLTACEQSKSDASETAAAPAPKKSLARPAQMYAGQEQILQVATASVTLGPSGGLEMKAAGTAAMPGYTHAGFLPRINAAPPADGVYEVDVVADRPAAGGAAAGTPIEVKGAWSTFPKDRLKGVKFIAKNNSVVAMLPPA